MGKKVVRIQEGVDFTGIGGLAKRLIHPKTVGSKNLGMSIIYLNPGEEVREHTHPWEEAYFIIQGEGLMYLEGEGDIELEKNLSIYVPGDAAHSQKNTGNEPLIIICSFSPPPSGN